MRRCPEAVKPPRPAAPASTGRLTSSSKHCTKRDMSDTHACSTAQAEPASGEASFMADGGEEQLVHLTALAAEKVLEIRKAEGIEDDMVLRLRVIGGGCSGFSYD